MVNRIDPDNKEADATAIANEVREAMEVAFAPYIDRAAFRLGGSGPWAFAAIGCGFANAMSDFFAAIESKAQESYGGDTGEYPIANEVKRSLVLAIRKMIDTYRDKE